MMTKLLADAEAYFGRPQTAENRASIAEIWANSSLKDVPDEMAYKTFHEVISECSWQSQLLPAWKKAIEKARGEHPFARIRLQPFVPQLIHPGLEARALRA